MTVRITLKYNNLIAILMFLYLILLFIQFVFTIFWDFYFDWDFWVFIFSAHLKQHHQNGLWSGFDFSHWCRIQHDQSFCGIRRYTTGWKTLERVLKEGRCSSQAAKTSRGCWHPGDHLPTPSVLFHPSDCGSWTTDCLLALVWRFGLLV